MDIKPYDVPLHGTHKQQAQRCCLCAGELGRWAASPAMETS